MSPFTARYSLAPGGGAPAEEGACTVELGEGAVTLSPSSGPALRIRLAEILAWRVHDYAVTLDLAGGARAVLSAMGKRLDPFCAALPAARAEHLGEALLLLERGAAAEEHGEFRRGDGSGEPCRVRLQRTSLVVFPRETLPFRIGLGEVRALEFDADAYAVRLILADAPALELRRFGKRTDALQAGLRERRDALAARGLRALGALAQDLPALALRTLGALLPDGVPASRAALEQAVPGAWEAIRLRSFAAGERREAAAHLAERAQEAWVAVKETDPAPAEGGPEGEAGEGEQDVPQRQPAGAPEPAAGEEAAPGAGSTLPPELAGREVLYLFRIGGALALELPSSTESATYVFRAGEQGEQTVRQVVRAMAAIQFRREPISLPDEQLLGARGARYGEALALVPGLRAARQAFLGRAVHAGAEAWRKALDAALARS
jgi:hypothetical protein